MNAYIHFDRVMTLYGLKFLCALSSDGRATVLYTVGPWFESKRAHRNFKSIYTTGRWFESNRAHESFQMNACQIDDVKFPRYRETSIVH